MPNGHTVVRKKGPPKNIKTGKENNLLLEKIIFTVRIQIFFYSKLNKYILTSSDTSLNHLYNAVHSEVSLLLIQITKRRSKYCKTMNYRRLSKLIKINLNKPIKQSFLKVSATEFESHKMP